MTPQPMTPEQEVERLVREQIEPLYHSYIEETPFDVHRSVKDDMLDFGAKCYNAGIQAGAWIPTDTKLPEPLVSVLVMTERDWFKAWRTRDSGDGWHWYMPAVVGRTFHPEVVTHWMPIPPLPQEGRE